MILEIVTPFKNNPQRTYFKCIDTHKQSASDNAWDLRDMLSESFMRHTLCIVNFDGYENCVAISNTPAPYLK